jgi:cob(I)alamin adenosyltransferase
MALTEEDRQWIRAELERVETKLLMAFHSWASPVEMRQRTHSAPLRALDQEMENLQDRVKKLEQPPTA